MDKLNVQRTWLPFPGMGKHAGTDTIQFIFHEGKTKVQKVNLHESGILYHTSETGDY